MTRIRKKGLNGSKESSPTGRVMFVHVVKRGLVSLV